MDAMMTIWSLLAGQGQGHHLSLNINDDSLNEETDKDECGMTYESISNHMLTVH
jgi:hypothetical protein